MNELLQALYCLAMGYYIGTYFRCLSCCIIHTTRRGRQGLVLAGLSMVLFLTGWFFGAFVPSVVCFAVGLYAMVDVLDASGWYQSSREK